MAEPSGSPLPDFQLPDPALEARIAKADGFSLM